MAESYVTLSEAAELEGIKYKTRDVINIHILMEEEFSNIIIEFICTK